MNLHLLEDPAHPHAGGVLCTWPSGKMKALQWVSRGPIHDTMAMGKDLAARALQSCLDERRIDDAERTNWPSAVAACAALVRKWNARYRQAPENPSPGRPKQVQAPSAPRFPGPEPMPPALEALGMVMGAVSLLEGAVAGGGGGNWGEGGHPPGAPPHTKPQAETRDSEKSVEKISEKPKDTLW